MSSIYLIETVSLNGWNHGLIIRGENINNPVLLHLHGGPGESEYSAYLKFKLQRLEKLFTICYFEQRGAGKSYSANLPAETMNLEQLVEDANELTLYLKAKFRQRKIFILGHSFGTLLGSFLINKYPENYYAYMGVSHMSNFIESKNLSANFILNEASGEKNVLEEVLKLKRPAFESSPNAWYDYLKKQGGFIAKFGGLLYKDDICKIDENIKNASEYTAQEKENYFKGEGSRFSFINLWKTLLKTDLARDLKTQFLPIFIFHGIHDYITPCLLAKEYFDILKAPVKKFYAFESSAHFPYTEEYDKFEKIIKEDILINI